MILSKLEQLNHEYLGKRDPLFYANRSLFIAATAAVEAFAEFQRCSMNSEFDSAPIESTTMRYVHVHLFAVYSAVWAVYISIDLEEHIALACAKFPGVPLGMPKSIESNC